MTALPISEPGIYAGIPMAEYHAQLTVGPSISSGGLRTITSKSPAHYFATSYLNPHAEKVDTTPFRIGKAAHSLLLGDEVFEEHFAVAPFDGGRNTSTGDWKAGEKQTWWSECQVMGRVPLSKDEYARILGMRDVLMREPLIQDGLLGGDAERSIICRDEETGVWLKARPDVIPKSGWMVDYKTVADAHPRKIQRAVFDHGYHQQLGLAAECLAQLGEPVPREYALVCQEKTPPYAVTIQSLPIEAIWAGVKQNRSAIRTFAQCLSEGVWPGYGEADDLTTPQYIIDRCAGIETPAWLKPLENDA